MLILQPIGSHFLFVIIIAFAENSLIEWSIQLELRWDLEDEHALDKHFYNSRLKMFVNTWVKHTLKWIGGQSRTEKLPTPLPFTEW